ncbi:Mitogen-activated protein kinase kinase kinase 4 [Varanus komodoensis]|nr:Mitogen-activated protein kinase kinase kinase 4 [Varanus komodoensis]
MRDSVARAMEEPEPECSSSASRSDIKGAARKQECKFEDVTCKISDSDPEESSDEANTEIFYGTSPPSTPRQMKRMSTKHLKNNVGGRSASRSALKEKMSSPNQLSNKDNVKPLENTEEHSYKQGKKIRATLRTTERDHKKNVQCSFMLDSVSGSLPKKSIPDVDLNKPYLSLGCSNAKPPVSVPVPIAKTTRQTSRTDYPADRLKFFETLRLLLKLTSVSKKKDKEQKGQESTASVELNRSNELIWLELQAWHAGRTIKDQDLYLYTARQAIPDIVNEILTFKVNYGNLSCVGNGTSLNGTSGGQCKATHGTSAMGYSSYHEHLHRQRVSFEQVKRIMELLEYVEALYPSLKALQSDYEKYAARDFQDRVQALCLWLNITKDLNQKLRIMGTVLGIKDLSDIGWPVFEIPSPQPFRHNPEDEDVDEDRENSGACTEESEEEEQISEENVEELRQAIQNNFANKSNFDFEAQDHLSKKLDRLVSEDDSTCWAVTECSSEADCSKHCLTSIYRPFVDKALKQMGLRKLILRLHKLMHGSLQRARMALIKSDQQLELVRECKEVLKGGLLMKQYYQFMLREVLDDLQKNNCNIDPFEEDLHKMLMVYFDYMRSWIQMLQQLPQASHSLKNLLEEEWNFTKEITPYIRGGVLLKSTGIFLDSGLQKSCDEFWATADDSPASDEIRRSVIETSRALKELFHEARERASKALGFAKRLRKVQIKKQDLFYQDFSQTCANVPAEKNGLISEPNPTPPPGYESNTFD